MADKPIPFSAPMIRALIAGAKTQTRRVIKPRRRCSLFDGTWSDGYVLDAGNASWRADDVRYAVGDRLWVREAHAVVPRTAYRASEGVEQMLRPDDNHDAAVYREGWERSKPGSWRPSIHMPRWASRLTLLVTDVRVQRLQEITWEDAEAEGVWHSSQEYREQVCIWRDCVPALQRLRVKHFAKLWNSINGPDAWDANPWVVAVSFEAHHRNIDQMEARQCA